MVETNMAKESKKELTKQDNFNYNVVSKILLIFIMLGPVFDIVSFLFRKNFESKISISTFIRPIIPICIAIYIFFTANKKNKKILFLIALLYLSYGILHLLIVRKLFVGCSDGSIINEAQYIANFTFLAIDLIIYLYTFVYEGIYLKKDSVNRINKKISNSITIMVAIYLISIFIAIITKTSSPTYIETNTGYKGWIESGNSLSEILVVSLFIILASINLKKMHFFEILKIIVAILDFAYLTTTIGTRTGLIGAFLALVCYIILEIIFSKNKKVIIAGTLILVVGATGVFAFGSKTIKRRKEVKLSQYTIIDKATGEVGNMTGDMLDIKNSILDGTIDESFMTDAQKQATLDLYKYAKEHKIAGNDTRRQQLIYNAYLVKRQKNLLYILFGNGLKTNFREMVMENELASLLLNFGIIGFILYASPLLVILVFSAKTIIEKNSKNNEIYIDNSNLKTTNEENLKKQIMYFLALLLVLALSWLSGYVLFATSSMVVISALSVLNTIRW